jgi:hypothetical protein
VKRTEIRGEFSCSASFLFAARLGLLSAVLRRKNYAKLKKKKSQNITNRKKAELSTHQRDVEIWRHNERKQKKKFSPLRRFWRTFSQDYKEGDEEAFQRQTTHCLLVVYSRLSPFQEEPRQHVETAESDWIRNESIISGIPGALKFHTHLLHIVTSFSTRFDKHNIQLFRFSFAFLRRHLTFVRQIGFVSYQHDDDIGAAFRSHIVDPLRRLMEWIGIWERKTNGERSPSSSNRGGLTCYIINDHSDCRVSNVRWNERSEALLPSGILRS